MQIKIYSVWPKWVYAFFKWLKKWKNSPSLNAQPPQKKFADSKRRNWNSPGNQRDCALFRIISYLQRKVDNFIKQCVILVKYTLRIFLNRQTLSRRIFMRYFIKLKSSETLESAFHCPYKQVRRKLIYLYQWWFTSTSLGMPYGLRS